MTRPGASSSALTDPFLEARKGRLYVLAGRGVDEAMWEEVYRRYYSDPCFDVLPSLQAALVAAYASSPGALEALPVAVVIQGLDMYGVGTSEGAVWLVRSGEVRELLGSPTEAWVTAAQVGGRKVTLRNVRRRLNVGDSLILTTQEASARLSPARFRQVVLAKGSPRVAAQTIARFATRGKAEPVPVIVIHIPGFAPAPELGPAKTKALAEPRTEVRTAPQASPIWPALVLAVLAIGVSLWLRRSALSRENLSVLVNWFLTPAPTRTMILPSTPSEQSGGPIVQPTTRLLARQTSTPVSRARRVSTLTLTPSPTATREYPLPELRYPLEGAKIRDVTLTLRWVWAGSLAEDEYFDVRLWAVGTPKRGIAWTKDREYTQRYQGGGNFYWTVVVIRGENGVVVSELSQEPQPIGFEWRIGEGSPTNTPTPVPTLAPTRSTPLSRPTRVTATPQPTETEAPTPTSSTSKEP